ncbi:MULTISPECIES: IS5 family transposase [Pseudomonas syringae group genomosp. 2]|nr:MULTISPECIES: IS5 family transposase [Pseudomonas syringae group genomosp. 2]MCQ3013520.1 IS5 family transposase [Pseudomonas savastanoi]WGQ00897.1 IS5 family transposase [Pseudomonas amygdali pv. aesculi]
MTDRYEISSERWAIIEAIISPPQHMGRPRRDDRQMLDGIFWILCSGAKWRDLPERFGPWKTVYQRFRQWRDNGKFEQVLRHLHLRLREDGFIDLDTWMVDSTSIRASRAASGAGKKRGPQEPQHHCLGRSRGGLTTKIHLACDSHGIPLAIMLSPGEQADSRYFMPLLDQISLPGSRGRPRKRCRYVLADKGYDSQVIRQYCDRYGMQPVIPLRKMHRKPRPGLPRLFDRPQYKKRNVIERVFSWLKEKRRIFMRYDKLASSFKAMVTLACIEKCLRADFSDKP